MARESINKKTTDVRAMRSISSIPFPKMDKNDDRKRGDSNPIDPERAEIQTFRKTIPLRYRLGMACLANPLPAALRNE
jgi:hypothetical protein